MKDTELTMTYRLLDKKCATFYYKLNSQKEFEPEWFVPTAENLDWAWTTWTKLKEEVLALPAPDAVYALVKHHFCDFMESLEYTLKELEQNPFHDFFCFHEYFLGIARLDNRHNVVRQTVLTNRIKHFQKNTLPLLHRSKEILSQEEQNTLADSLRQEQHALHLEVPRLIEYFPAFSTDQVRELADAFFTFHHTLDHLISSLSSEVVSDENIFADDVNRSIKTTEKDYRRKLHCEYGISLEELSDWCQKEMETTRTEVFEIASRLDIPESTPTTMTEVNRILFKYEGPCSSPEEMFARADAYLARTRALAHDYVKLPDEESCQCDPIPYYYKDGYPWGGYEGGDFRKLPFQGHMFLNQHNYQNITDGWIKLNALHEAYPGHHVQYVRAALDPLPETVKIGAKLTPLLEGTCLRTERAFETIFEEDPFFPLFVAYRRHHGSVRICVDLMLYYYGAPLKDAIALYQKELGFDFSTARKQVQAHQNVPGYFTCYYYGMKKIEDWEKKLGLDKKEFTELLFSAGYISMESFDMYMMLSPEERERYYSEFKSLWMK